MSNIIGNGLIASEINKFDFNDLPPCLFFASGVSNSKCIDLKEYRREEILLEETLQSVAKSTILIYFSTCSIYDDQAREKSIYIKHKVMMESLVSNHSKFIIFRLPQVVGFTKNKFTLTNYFFDNITNDKTIQIQTKATRNLIDVQDAMKLVIEIIKTGDYLGRVINIANPKNISIIEIITIMEKLLGKTAIYEAVNAGSSYFIPVPIVNIFSQKCDINFGDDYSKILLSKYYSR